MGIVDIVTQYNMGPTFIHCCALYKLYYSILHVVTQTLEIDSATGN